MADVKKILSSAQPSGPRPPERGSVTRSNIRALRRLYSFSNHRQTAPKKHQRLTMAHHILKPIGLPHCCESHIRAPTFTASPCRRAPVAVPHAGQNLSKTRNFALERARTRRKFITCHHPAQPSPGGLCRSFIQMRNTPQL